MTKLERFWRTLDSLPCWELTLPEWRAQVREEWELVFPLLRPTNGRGATYPCPGPEGDGCPREVIEHLDGEVVAVCGADPRRCERVVLRKEDLILYEVDLSKLVAPIGEALGFRPSIRREQQGSWYLGASNPAGLGAIPVYLASPSEPEDLGHLVTALALDTSHRFILLTPTVWDASSSDLQRLGRSKSLLLALEDLLSAGKGGRLVPDPALPTQLLGRFSPLPAAPTFRLDGGVWILSFNGKTVQQRDSKGLRYLRSLLRSSDGKQSCEVLLAKETGHQDILLGRGMEKQDRLSIEKLRAKIESDESELDHAHRHEDLGRIEFLTERLAMVRAQLAGAVGLRGRLRKTGDSYSQIRNSVGKAIRRAIQRLEEPHEELHRHLKGAVKLGLEVCYSPAEPVTWITE